jgi:Family of unknown function (DUF6353)
MALSDLVTKIQELTKHNSNGILTAVGVAGTISTAVLTGRASFRAAKMIKNADKELKKESKFTGEPYDLDTKDKIRLVWSLYIPPVGVGALTITSIIMANRLAGKQAAALAAAYSVSERALSEYREKVIEKLGESKEQDVRDSVAQARVNKNPVNTREVILAGTGESLCYDMLSGRYFQSSVEAIKKAENAVNFEIVNFMSCSLSKFYDEIGLPPTTMSDLLGFNLDNRCEVNFSTTMSSDDRPCIAIDFNYVPVQRFNKHWG